MFSVLVIPEWLSLRWDEGEESDGETVADAIELLIKTNHCRETKRTETQMGRPAIAYQWNPALGAAALGAAAQ